MAGFGGELLFFIGLGYVVLGPQRMHSILQKIASAKREFDKTRGELGEQLEAHFGREGDLVEREPEAEIPSAARDPQT